MRVLRIKYGPGEKSVMHGHPASVAVFLTDGRVKMTSADGTTSLMEMTKGQTVYLGPHNHLPETTGAGGIELILVELK